MKSKSPFIVFEGIEGVGKSTQIDVLSKEISETKQKVIKTFEPGATILGKEIRKLLLESSKSTKISSLSELLLFSADRAQHVSEIIKPALENDTVVLCDRFIYSTLAYQCYGRGLSAELVNLVNSLTLEDLTPDLVILLDIDPEIGLKRAKKRQDLDRIESLELSFHKKVREGFLTLAKDNKEIFITVDAEKSIEDISENIFSEIQKRFNFSG